MKGLLIVHATRTVLAEKRFFILFFLVVGTLLWFFLYIPVRNIPGNDFRFQLSILTPRDITFLIILSSLTALSIVMNLYVLSQRFNFKSTVGLVGQGGFGSLVGMIGSIFGTASCSSCVVSLFGFLGIGGVFFLLHYKQAIALAAMTIMLASLHFSSKSVLGVCTIRHE